MDSPKLNPSFIFDALHCEERWDCNEESIESETRNSIWEEGEEGEVSVNPNIFGEFLELNSLREDEELISLLIKEKENEPSEGFEDDPFWAKAREDSVEWILKVVRYYSFSAVTAILAVNYLDRFLNGFKSRGEKPWLTQLVAISSLSLAAKVEETEVPLLLDLQVEEPKFVFESKTIQRMEILILFSLQWKMNPVNPLSFLDLTERRLMSKTNISKDFFRRCESLLLSVISDSRFMCHRPSAMAAATMLYVISNLEPRIGFLYQDQLVDILGINKEKVEDCCRLIQDVATRSVHFTSNKRKFLSLPDSPTGVISATFSSDDSWTVASVSSSPEPISKKIKPSF